MKNRIFTFLIVLTFIMTIFVSPTKYAFAEDEHTTKEAGTNVEARSVILIEPNSGEVIFEKNSKEKFAPASVTKVMTMLLAIEAVDNGKIKLDDKVTCSENAKKMGGSTMLLDTGEVRTIEDLLKGIAIASGNDAAVAVAEYLGGSVEGFVELMNKRAKELGMNDTTFKNPTGLPDEGHLTTAYDISLMSRELLKHPKILKYTSTYMETITENRKSPIELVNHNKLVRFFTGCDGLKTGFTDEAKYCISATAVRNGVRMLTVIMGAPTYKIRNKDASMLMNFGFSKFEAKKIVGKDIDIEKVTLKGSADRFFMAKTKEDFTVVVPRGKAAEITTEIVIDKGRKLYKAGDVVGHCEYFVNGSSVGKVELYADREVEKNNFFDNILDNFKKLKKNSI